MLNFISTGSSVAHYEVYPVEYLAGGINFTLDWRTVCMLPWIMSLRVTEEFGL